MVARGRGGEREREREQARDRDGRWEHTVLRVLSYPANLAFAGTAAFVMAIPVVTALPAAVAAARSMDGWLREDDGKVFTSTFRQFARTWRRTLPLGVLATVVVAVLVVDGFYLWTQVSAGSSGLALAVGAASVPVAVCVALVLLALPVAAARRPDGSVREWLTESAYLVASRPVRALLLLVLCSAAVVTLTAVPTLLPFFGFSVPVFLALVSLGRSPARGSTGTTSSRTPS